MAATGRTGPIGGPVAKGNGTDRWTGRKRLEMRLTAVKTVTAFMVVLQPGFTLVSLGFSPSF